MGCNDRDWEPSEEYLQREQVRLHAQEEHWKAREAQQKYYESIIGPKSIGRPTAKQLKTQIALIDRKEAIRNERRALEQKLKALENEVDQLNLKCIHFDKNGEPSIEPGIYHTCKHCPESW